MSNWKEDYWDEALRNALEDQGIVWEAPEPKFRKVVKSLVESAENQSLCSAPVESYEKTEIDNLKRKFQKEKDLWGRQEKTYRDCIRKNYSLGDIDLELRDC